MIRSKWMRVVYMGVELLYRIVSFPFQILFGIIELIDTVKSKT